MAALNRKTQVKDIGDGVADSKGEEVAFGRPESLAAGFEREADIELCEESPIVDLPLVSGSHEDLPSAGSKLKDGRRGDADDGLISILASGGDEAKIDGEAFGLSRAPSSDERDVTEPRDGFLIDSIFFKASIEEGNGGFQNELVRDAIGSADAITMEDCLDVSGIRNLLVSTVEVIANAEGVIYGETKAGIIVIEESANWRGGEFSSVSSKGL